VCEECLGHLTHARVLRLDCSGFAHLLGDDCTERDQHEEQ
jgi:hypothetical protein